MKTITSLVLAAAVVAGGASLAAPAFAVPPGGTTNVLQCSTGNDQELLNQSKHELAQQLQLRTKSTPTIDDWNGCLKVQYTDSNGHTVVALYDPDSLSLVNTLS